MNGWSAVPEAAAPRVDARLRGECWAGDLDGIRKRGLLRVLVVPDRVGFFYEGAHLRGSTYDAVKRFASFLRARTPAGSRAVRVVFVPVRRDEVVQSLAEGRGDIAAAMLSVTRSRLDRVDFSVPVYAKARLIPVTGPAAGSVSSVDALAGREIYVRRSSAAWEALEDLSTRFGTEGRPPIRLVAADENLEDDDILEMVNAGLVPMTVAAQPVAAFWAPILQRLRLQRRAAVGEASIAWAVRKDAPQLQGAVNKFIATHKAVVTYGNVAVRGYLKGARYLQRATAADEMAKFMRMAGVFERYGDQYQFPHLLAAAKAYQESRLDNRARSAGAVGVMQIKPSIAAAKPVGVTGIADLERNIEAGVKYLRSLADECAHFSPSDPPDRYVLAVAAYNLGPSRVRALRQRALAEGYDPNRWFGNVEMIAARALGQARAQHVRGVYKYYLGYGMELDRRVLRTAAQTRVR